jgi:hypothetical protein
MPLKTSEYQDVWGLIRVAHKRKEAGTALKRSMGGDESPQNLRGEIAAGEKALADDAGRWDEALESAANALLDMSTAQADKQQGAWLALLDKYLHPSSFSKAIGDRVGNLTPSAFVAQKRKAGITVIVNILLMHATPDESAQAGEDAVLKAYKDIYDARQKAILKSFWASTDTEAHLGAVWAAAVSLRVTVEQEKARLVRVAQEQERQRKALEEQLEKEAQARELKRKRLVPVLTWTEEESSYNRHTKDQINQTCEKLARQYPMDVQGAYDQDLVQDAIDKAKQRLLSTYGYQLSSNKRYAVDAFYDLVATAAKKKYPLEEAGLIDQFVEMAIGMYFIGASGSDDAEKSMYVELRR